MEAEFQKPKGPGGGNQDRTQTSSILLHDEDGVEYVSLVHNPETKKSQRPHTFTKEPMGANYLGSMMKTISEEVIRYLGYYCTNNYSGSNNYLIPC